MIIMRMHVYVIIIQLHKVLDSVLCKLDMQVGRVPSLQLTPTRSHRLEGHIATFGCSAVGSHTVTDA